MVTDEEDFVRVDLLALSQFELDGNGRAKPVAVTFANRIGVSGRDNRAVGLGIIGATRRGRALENLPLGRNVQPMA